MGKHWDKKRNDIQEAIGQVSTFAFGIAIISIPVALILGLGRFAVYLKVGSAPKSICATVAYLTDLNPFDCVFETEWIGFNDLATWTILTADASLATLLIGAIFLALAISFTVLWNMVGRKDEI